LRETRGVLPISSITLFTNAIFSPLSPDGLCETGRSGVKRKTHRPWLPACGFLEFDLGSCYAMVPNTPEYVTPRQHAEFFIRQLWQHGIMVNKL
jgi:hypothetical protein